MAHCCEIGQSVENRLHRTPEDYSSLWLKFSLGLRVKVQHEKGLHKSLLQNNQIKFLAEIVQMANMVWKVSAKTFELKKV